MTVDDSVGMSGGLRVFMNESQWVSGQEKQMFMSVSSLCNESGECEVGRWAHGRHAEG